LICFNPLVVPRGFHALCVDFTHLIGHSSSNALKTEVSWSGINDADAVFSQEKMKAGQRTFWQETRASNEKKRPSPRSAGKPWFDVLLPHTSPDLQDPA
jgi:hypothetical protein